MYINAKYDSESDKILVAERTPSGRKYKEYDPDHSFYVQDPKGIHKSIYGDPVTRLTPSNKKDKARLLKINGGKKTFETDINPIVRCLEQNYHGGKPANLNVAFFDIETDFHQERGYSSPDEAFNPITSIAVYLQWQDTMVCIAVPPRGMSREEAESIAEEVGECVIVDTEKEMLQIFVEIIKDADVLSGWNSEFYDIPYTLNRTIHLLGKNEIRKYCFWNSMPKKKTIERGGGDSSTWELIGRVHLDYLQLYKKYTYEERQSYSLNNIAEHELGEKKVDYDGTLDQLYNQDFKKFLEYNIQDTRLLDRLDQKLQYIDLANTIAYDTHVLLPATMGSVAVVESAITAEAHERGFAVQNKVHHDGDTRAAGGWVQHPKKGLHKMVGSTDLNSLYPSVLRALNMSSETIVGQIRTHKTNHAIEEYIAQAKKHSFAEWWNDRFNILELEPFLSNDPHEKILFDMEDGQTYELTGAEMRQLIFAPENNWCISANGTVFKTDVEGVIPGLLARWYAERKQMKKVLWNMIQLRTGLIKTDLDSNLFTQATTLPDMSQVGFEDLNDGIKLVETGDDVDSIVNFVHKYGLEVREGAIWVTEQNLAEWKDGEEYWDKRQLVKKILLNSLYGGLLNQHCRFFDQRLGQSTTLTGRSITRHMAAKANELLAGEYDETGRAVIYGDTDSCIGSTQIETSLGTIRIEDLYDQCLNHSGYVEDDKEYAQDPDIMVMSYDKTRDEPYMGHIDYVYRHRVNKDLYEIEDEFGNVVTVTEDHSIMVERNSELIEVKPVDIDPEDVIISIHVKHK